ncbi:MAG TPA: hypothetical protein DCS87_02160 [Rheinheimera sp.]|nr:hypothetical protein [Rheinheimera sp.]
MHLFNQVIQVLTSPLAGFNELKAKTSWRWQLLPLQLLLMALVMWFFYQGMSLPHLVEQQLLLAGPMNPAEKEQATAVLGQMASNMAYIAPAMAVVTSLIVTSLCAIYFLLVSRFDKRYSFGDWFQFAVWTQLPMLINLLGLVVLVLLASSPDVPLTLANYASINQLFDLTQPGDAKFNLLENLNLFYVWQIILAAAGLERWLDLSKQKAYALAALPYVLIFGLWAL